MKNELYNKSILITGGTGSFGKAFVRYLLNLKKKMHLEGLLFLAEMNLNSLKWQKI